MISLAISTELSLYRYEVASFDVLFEGEKDPTVVMPDYVNGLNIEKDFDNAYFPVTWIKVMLDTKLYFKIVANKDTVRFRLRVQKYSHGFDTDPTISATPIKRNIFNETFCIILDEDTPLIDKQTTEDLYDPDAGLRPEDSGGKEFTFFLFKEKDLTASRKLINTVLANVTVTDAVTYCLSTTGLSKVLMAPFDNKTKYSEMLLPPLTMLGNLEYLENYYGMFEHGLLAFFDIERIYMVDMSSKCKAWAQEEYKKTVFNVRSDNSAYSMSPGSYDNEKEKTQVINITPGNINLRTPSVTVDQLEGNNIYYIDPGTGAINTHKADTKHRGAGNYKVLVDKYNNVYARHAERIRREELSGLAEINIGDFDIDALTPNKEFVLTFEDSAITKSHGGSYRLSYALLTFIKDGKSLRLSASTMFNKI